MATSGKVGRRAPSKKGAALLRLHELCKERGSPEFSSADVKAVIAKSGFVNPFDATKVDHSSQLPEALRRKDIAFIRLGLGRFTFVEGVKRVYHRFEPIPENKKERKRPYKARPLDHADDSEGTLLSTLFNQGFLQGFLYESAAVGPQLYVSRRTNMPLTFELGDSAYKCKRVQMEMDMVMEHEGRVTVFEGKNRFEEDFNVFQLYNPFRYFSRLRDEKGVAIKEVDCCYVAREEEGDQHVVRLHRYGFARLLEPESIKLLDSVEYRLTVKK